MDRGYSDRAYIDRGYNDRDKGSYREKERSTKFTRQLMKMENEDPERYDKLNG